jgi:hypothetical protein
MGDNLSFNMILNDKIIFNQDSTFENFIGQFQTSCSKILCIENGSYLKFYDKNSPIPMNIRFDYKQSRSNLTEYYFRDIQTNDQYCVFGRECAKLFFPRIDEVDPIQPNVQPIIKSEKISKQPEVTKPKRPIITKHTNKGITIIDQGKTLTFLDIDYPIEVVSYSYKV